ncbi:MAG TPA: flavoprotein [Gaiellaceae bacterium]|nr:flavoprotein [Gaiellaceae bacterium]
MVGIAAREQLVYGARLLEALHRAGEETHVVLTPAASAALGDEAAAVLALADRSYAASNQAARISSGSFLTRGMVVAPCDGGSLAAIAMGLATNLVYRAADVTLKEGRPLVLGLVGAGAGRAQRESLERAARVPGLVTLRLEGSLDDGVDSLLAALGLGRGPG